jgi:hypothetical protein
MSKRKYNLGFISDDLIYDYVKETVSKYVTFIDFKKFNSNIVDPIKLTFDAKVYGRTIEQVIEDECMRQIDKANSNLLGYFHQNIFKIIGGGWSIPDKGFDIINNKRRIYVEMKNKHNTMNASASRDIYLTMLNKVSQDPRAKCMLVEVIAKQSQFVKWEGSFKGEKLSNDRIFRVSIDRFYEVVFKDKNAFMKLCKALPIILDDIVSEIGVGGIQNTVQEELNKLSKNTLKSLYLSAFKSYEGFNQF